MTILHHRGINSTATIITIDSVSEDFLNYLQDQLRPFRRSQLLLEIKQLDWNKVGVELLISLWLRRLPESTNAISTFSDSGFFELLANTFEKIHEVHARPAVSEWSWAATGQITELQQTVATLVPTVLTLVQQLKLCVQKVGPELFRGSPTEMGDRVVACSAICWYHRIFANKAKMCTSPC